MYRLLTAAGLSLGLNGAAPAQEGPPLDAERSTVESPAALSGLDLSLPPGLAEDANRDASADAVEGRALTDSAMARALGAAVVDDWDIALIHAERAAAGGEARGATLAGHIYLNGLSSQGRDEEAALRWLRRAGEQNEPDALVILARLATNSRAGLLPSQAREFLAQAAEAGDIRAAHEYGLYLMSEGDPGAAPDALDWLRLAAESGRVTAMVDYAEALGDWVHGPGDLAAARTWYANAAQNGNGLAAAIAGTMYLEGEGGEADPARGVRLIQTGAELGEPAAMGSIALLLFNGAPGLPADPPRAASWARQGAEAGDGESQFLYAYALATGDGTQRNLERAYYWVRRAAAEGLATDPDRLQLEAALEGALPGSTRDRILAEAASDASPF